jgi:chromosome segregation protein
MRLQDTISTTDEDIQTLQDVIRWDEERLQAYDKKTADDQDVQSQTVRAKLLETREAYQESLRLYDRTVQEQNSRRARLHAIADERVTLNNRQIRARERLKALEARRESLTSKMAALQEKPGTTHADQDDLLDQISSLEKTRDKATETLATREVEVTATTKALREAEKSLGEAKEARAHAQATLAGILEQQTALTRTIEEQFDMPPARLSAHITLDLEGEQVQVSTLRTQKEQLTRSRDQIGPVNLRAQEEAGALEKELATLLHERNDLVQAIEELRGGISTINKEARARLLSAFEHVNAHFGRLFLRLFGGGKAHLALIDAEDPLQSGLEIFAQPPGKTLQSLSLLSGGEQTMASIALIFAMFLTNPSPICVLDEIDAPLDDANVDRVCDLLGDIAARGETRFLIITHHRLTMARMDRLYGVTMAEKGISQLVSVDLHLKLKSKPPRRRRPNRRKPKRRTMSAQACMRGLSLWRVFYSAGLLDTGWINGWGHLRPFFSHCFSWELPPVSTMSGALRKI